MELEITDFSQLKHYHNALVLAGTEIPRSVRDTFRKDCQSLGIPHAVITNVEDNQKTDIDLSTGTIIRYYSIQKGQIVGMETGKRSGDAIKIMAGGGRKSENVEGGLF